MTYNNYARMGLVPTKIGAWLTNYLWKKMLRFVGPLEGSILEVGPGRGHVAFWAKEKGYDYKAVEASLALTTSLQNQGIDCVWCDGQNLNQVLSSKSYLNVVMLNVLEHVYQPDKLIADCREKLMLGGKLLIAVPHYDKRFYSVAWDHRYPMTPERLRGLATAAEFRQCKTKFVSFVFTGFSAWLWSRLYYLFPFELPLYLWPESKWAVRWNRLGSFFALRIFCEMRK